MNNLLNNRPRRGALLLMVIGLLATLAMVAVSFHGQSKTSKELSETSLFRSQARLLARSGYEQAIRHLSNSVINEMTMAYEVTVPSDVHPGAEVHILAQDLSGRINVNDGLRAGHLELGGSYVASSLNPWPSGPADISAWINLRLRRILNAYGEALRLEHNTAPEFAFLSSDAEARGTTTAYEPNSRALGDSILRYRPDSGYGKVEDLKDIVNTWASSVSLAIPVEFDDAFDLVREDLTVESWEDESFFRLKDESRFGNYTPMRFDNRRAQILPRSMVNQPPDMTDLFEPHSVALININAASDLVRTAVFYAPANVSLPVYGGSPVLQPTVADADTSNGPAEFGNTNVSTLGVGGPCFEDGLMTEGGIHYTTGTEYCQVNRLMSLNDARNLATCWSKWVENEGYAPRNFDEFTALLNWHWSEWLPGLGLTLERSADSTAFDDDSGGGAFLQNYLQKILPHILSCNRRMPRWYGAPAALLSPLYKPVKPSTSRPDRYGIRTAEDFCYRSTLPKVSFLPSGSYQIRSEAVLPEPVDVRAVIRAKTDLFTRKAWRTQAEFESITVRSGPTPTDAAVIFGPEFTVHRGGAMDPDQRIGFAGLQDQYKEPDHHPFIHIKSDVEEVLGGFPSTIPPTRSEEDEYLREPWDFGKLQDHLIQANVMGPVDTNGDVLSIWNAPSKDIDISPFGGLNLNSYGHGLRSQDEGGVFYDTMYWNLGPMLNNGIWTAGERMHKGLVNMWVRLPTDYTYAPGNMSSFKTLFTLTVWDYTQPQIGVNSEEGGRQVVLLRPVELKAGFFFDHTTNRHTLVARCEQARVGRYLFEEKKQVNLNLHHLQTWLEWPSVHYEEVENYLPYLPGPLWREEDPMSFHPFAIPYGEDGGEGDPRSWTADQSRLLERRVTLAQAPQTKPGTWHRVSIGWHLHPEVDLENMLWARFINAEHSTPQDDMRNDGSSHDEPGAEPYIVKSEMFSFNHSHMFSIGEAIGRIMPSWEEMAQMDPSDVPWYSAWRLNSAVSDVQVYFGEHPPGFEKPGDSGYTDAGPQHRFPMTDPKWVLAPALGLTGMDDAKLLAFGARVYELKPSDPTLPETLLELVTWAGGVGGTQLTVIGNAEKGLDHYYDPDPNAADLIDINPVITWTTSKYAAATLADIPWIQEIHCHYKPRDYPRIRDWSEE